MQDITSDYPVTPESTRVGVIRDLQNMAGYEFVPRIEKALDIKAVNWRAPVKAPVTANRIPAPKIAEIHRPRAWPTCPADYPAF